MEPLAGEDPRVLGGYRLLGRLGAGGMGRVYLGRSAGGRTVAVKVVHAQFAADEQFRARFRREIESARRVGAAWTAPVLDADPDASVPWIATGYAAGPSLAQAVGAFGPLAEHSVRALGAGLAEALTAVHALGLVHRDVKPSNVLLTLDGPLLIDFGIARATDGTASLTATGVSVGSPGYMAPEQILGKGATGAADVFSLGAVLAFAATGVPPFPGDSSASLLYKVVHEEPELGPQLDGELRELVAGCLAKDPARRPAPEGVAARLAGDRIGGAAGLVRDGWLPAPVVEQVSRQAVELLNLEVEQREQGEVREHQEDREERAGAPGAAGTAGTAGVPSGTFGPPDPSYGAVSGLIPFDAPVQVEAEAPADRPGGLGTPLPRPTPAAPPSVPLTPTPPSAPPSTSSSTPPSVAPPETAWPSAGAPPATPHASGATDIGGAADRADPSGAAAVASTSDAAAVPSAPDAAAVADLPTGPPSPSPFPSSPSAPKERRIALAGAVGGRDRPRRVSCTLVLSVAGALAAATTAGFVFTLMRNGGGNGATATQPPSGHTASAQPSEPAQGTGQGTGEAVGDVPHSFLGTWSGGITMANGIPNGSMTSVIKAGHQGEFVVRTTYDALLVRCRAKAKLLSATDTELVLQESSDGTQGPGCTGNTSTVTYTLGKDGALTFTSDDKRGGTPKATLEKSG
ncbi:serine/threonine-protein kinase [Streptomyces sp. GS7]|uniref:serine/threonine-protein kinase n=1 Tax=Streptomyces sp. GS7 TaxID=2692234 RepID=UPI0013199A97|nr:serine/threonine-protein kinase [Streptomyces sp. GS7]QHC20370.1 protein kinase [Streptomyces sp. GS7]